MNKDYKELWHELKRWVEHNEHTLEEMITKTHDRQESERIKAKQHALSMVLGKIQELERR